MIRLVYLNYSILGRDHKSRSVGRGWHYERQVQTSVTLVPVTAYHGLDAGDPPVTLDRDPPSKHLGGILLNRLSYVWPKCPLLVGCSILAAGVSQILVWLRLVGALRFHAAPIPRRVDPIVRLLILPSLGLFHQINPSQENCSQSVVPTNNTLAKVIYRGPRTENTAGQLRFRSDEHTRKSLLGSRRATTNFESDGGLNVPGARW